LMAKSGLSPAHRITRPGGPLRPRIAIAMQRHAAHARRRAEPLMFFFGERSPKGPKRPKTDFKPCRAREILLASQLPPLKPGRIQAQRKSGPVKLLKKPQLGKYSPMQKP